MFDWESLRHYGALVRTGSLAGAARELRVEHATIARRIASLERELGVKLIDRRGRRIAITAVGREVAAILSNVETQALSIERIASGRRDKLAGEVTISAPPALGTAVLAKPLVELRANAPELKLQVITETRRSSLDKRESDIAIRLARPERGDLTAAKLGEILFHLYAAPDYATAVAPAEWAFIAFDSTMDDAPQQIALRNVAGNRSFAFRMSTAEMQLQLALSGGGVAMLPDFLVSPDSLVIVDQTELRREVWLVIHSDMVNSASVRATADALRVSVSRTLAGWAR